LLITTVSFHVCDCSDASKDSVDKALAGGGRLGLAPGGIAEMFEGYPKYGTNPNGEYVIVRNGVLKIALKHGVPVIPVYCFGSTKLLHRLSFSLLERLSTTLRASFLLFYGRFGLPIPFRQKLSYVIGHPINPPSINNHQSDVVIIETMMDELCQELHRIFDRHKEAYGWGHKSLHLIRR
jgi:Diacylglycerol acyltransferase